MYLCGVGAMNLAAPLRSSAGRVDSETHLELTSCGYRLYSINQFSSSSCVCPILRNQPLHNTNSTGPIPTAKERIMIQMMIPAHLTLAHFPNTISPHPPAPPTSHLLPHSHLIRNTHSSYSPTRSPYSPTGSPFAHIP